MAVGKQHVRAPDSFSEKRGKRGLTLVELLVVLLVIALLVAIALPVLSGFRSRAVQVRCAMQIRQNGVAMTTYAIDSLGNLPQRHQDTAYPFDTLAIQLENGRRVNMGLLRNYVGGANETLYCPTHNEGSSPDVAFDTAENPWGSGAGESGQPLRAGYAMRVLEDQASGEAPWRLNRQANKLMLTGFLGVDGWGPGGSFEAAVHAPHGGAGFNNYFGDGAVIWASSEGLDQVAPVGDTLPDAATMLAYHELIDLKPGRGGVLFDDDDDDDDGDGIDGDGIDNDPDNTGDNNNDGAIDGA